MNSVALPASSTTAPLSAEADLVRQAAGGAAEAFDELYRRHSQTAWRLAQAVAGSRSTAIEAVADGFAAAVVSHRRRHRADPGATFRPALLAAVYKSAVENPRTHSTVPTPADDSWNSGSRKRGAKAADAALVDVAFRSLPERWRGAVWLSEVETLDADRIAPILGVSTAVATQLVIRGRRGLTGRFAQAHRTAPDHLGVALRPLAQSVPANLAEATEIRWRTRSGDHQFGFAPITGWLSEHAVRPLWMAVAGLTALGLVGLGIVGQDTSAVSTTAGQAGQSPQAPAGGGTGVIPGSPCIAVCVGGGGLALTNIGTPGAAAGSGAVATGAPIVGSHSGSTGGSTGSGGGITIPIPGGTGIPTPPPPAPQPGSGNTKTVLNAGPVGSVTQTGKSTTVNVGSSGAASVTLGCNTIIGITVGSTTIGCTNPGTTTSSGSTATTTTTTTTTLPLLGTVTGITGKLLPGL